MKRNAGLAALAVSLLAAVVVACSEDAPPAGGGSNTTPPIGTGSRTDASASSDGAAEDASEEASTDLDGGKDADVDAPWVPGPSVCNPSMTVGAAAGVASTAGNDRFGAITPDELTLAWTVPSGGAAVLQIADRTAATDTFGSPQSPSDLVALDGVALAPSGLTLVAVAPDHRSFLVFERAGRTDAFVAGSSYAYDSIAGSLATGEQLGDPVFTSGDLIFLYSVYGGTSNDTVRYATRLSSGSSFDVGGSLAFTELRAQGSLRRRPSGAGSDFQTIFYWDEVSGSQKLGRLKGTEAAELYSVHDIGAVGFAQPNEACTRVYYGAAGSGGSDVFSAPVQ